MKKIAFARELGFSELLFGDVPEDSLDTGDLAAGVVSRRFDGVNVSRLAVSAGLLLDDVQDFSRERTLVFRGAQAKFENAATRVFKPNE